MVTDDKKDGVDYSKVDLSEILERHLTTEEQRALHRALRDSVQEAIVPSRKTKRKK